MSHVAIGLGISFIDTVDQYGGGVSEEIRGRSSAGIGVDLSVPALQVGKRSLSHFNTLLNRHAIEPGSFKA